MKENIIGKYFIKVRTEVNSVTENMIGKCFNEHSFLYNASHSVVTPLRPPATSLGYTFGFTSENSTNTRHTTNRKDSASISASWGKIMAGLKTLIHHRHYCTEGFEGWTPIMPRGLSHTQRNLIKST